MESKTNRESVKDLEEDLETNSDIALWKYIGPKIGEARNILFSAILDILDKSKSEENILRRDSLNSIHWKNAKKSIWTLSTTTDRQGSLRNVHLDSSVFQVLDDFSRTTDNKGTSRQNFNFRNQSTENLEKVILGRKNAVCVRLNRKAKKSTDIAKLSVQQKKHVGTSSVGLFSQDSIASKKSYYSVKRKKNLVIKCDYSNKSHPLSKHVLQVYQHQSSQVVPEEKSTNVSNEKFLVDDKEISKETKGESRESKSNVANTTVNMSVTNIACEDRNCRKSRRHKKSLQHKWSFMSLNRRHANRGKHEVESNKTSAQSTSYRAKFSKILSKLFNAGLQFSSITHRKDAEKRNNFHYSSPSVTSSSSDTSTLSAGDFRISSKYRTSKRRDLANRRSRNIPPPVAISYNNIPCAAPLFVPILNLPGSEQCKKELKPPDNKPSINSSFRLYPRSSKTRRFIDSFCGLKSRILASASRGKAPGIPTTPPSSSRTSIFSSCNSKPKYDLNRSMEKLAAENRSAFSPTRREEIRRESPTSRFEIPNGLRYERHHSPKIVASEIENPRRSTFGLPGHPIIVENSDGSNSDLVYSDNSFTLLSKEAFFSNRPRNTDPCCIPERKHSNDNLKYSMPPPKRSSPEDIFSTRQLHERPKVDHPYSPPSSENDFHYQNSYYPYQYIEHPSNPNEHTYFRGDNMYPQYLSAENDYPPSSMFSRAPSFMPARPISCQLPEKLPYLPPHLIVPQPPNPYYGTDPYAPPYYSYNGSQSYFVDPFTSCSTRSPTSSGSSVLYPLDPSGRSYSYRHDVPPTRSLREHLWYPHGQTLLPKVFDYQKYVNPDDQEEFARFGKSRSLSIPAYPMETFGSEYLLEPNYSAPKVRRRKMPKYMEYPHPLPQGPFNIMHPSNHPYYPQFPENPRELTHPSRRYNSRKHFQMDLMNRSNRKRRSTKSSCHSILLDQRISTRKGMGHGRQLAHSSSSVASITFNRSPKYETRNSSGSCSDVSVSRSSATILLSKYKSIDGKYRYQYRSSCTSSKTQTSESIMNFQNIKRRKKRVSCDCSKSRSKPMTSKTNEFNVATRHNSLYHCKPNEIPSASYRNMMGLRSQVCSSATDVYWNFKFKYGKIKHFDDRIKFELQKIGIDQLIEASKPAKCCKQTILNQPTKGNLPYAASLASLPLDDRDIKVIKQSVKMASKKKDINCGDSRENRKKLMYYANILSDDYNMRKPKVEPQYEIRYMYYKLYDDENVENLVNKKLNEKVNNKFHRLFSFLLERPLHNPKLLFDVSLNYHFKQSLVESVFKENRYFVNRPTIVPHEQSRLLRGYLVIESGKLPGFSESSKIALCYNIDERHKLFSKFSSQPQFDDLSFKDERFVLSRIFKKLSSLNISEAYRNLKKKTKKCLNSEEFIPKMNIYDLNGLMKSQMIESIVDKYEMMIVYSVQCFQSRICLKNICQHTYKSLEQCISSTPSIQLRLESCLSGLEAILRIIANFRTYVEKAITDDDKLLDSLERYLSLKMKVSISDTFNNAINFEVNIDELKDTCPFSSTKRKFTRNTKCLCCKNYKENGKYCCDKKRRLIKLIHQNQIVHSSIMNPRILSSKLMQELVTVSRNYSNGENLNILSSISENERFRQEQTCLAENFQGVMSEGLNNNYTVYETKNESSDVEYSVLGGEELWSKHFLRNFQLSKKNIHNDGKKWFIDLNEISLLFVQPNSRNKKRVSNPRVFFSFPSFSPGDHQMSCLHITNKTIVLVNNFHGSKISFLQMISSRKDIDKLYIHCVDVEVLTSKCRILCNMKRSTQLDYTRHILSEVSGISELFQCILRDYICYSRIVSLNRIGFVDQLNLKPTKLIEYSLYSTEIRNCLENRREMNSLEHSEESFRNLHSALVLQMCPRCLPTTENQIQNETVEDNKLFGMVAQLCMFETMKIAEHSLNLHKIKKMKRRQQEKRLLKKNYKSSNYNSSRIEEYQMDIEKESKPSSVKPEIEDEKTGDYEKQSGKRCQQKFPSEETKVTTILSCLGTSGGIVQRSGDSLESLLDDCLENGKLMNQGDIQPNERRKTINYKMVEDTLMECLNFKGNSETLQGMSHTILRYFTYTVFSEIKKNYYKHVSRKHRHSCCKKHRDFSVAYFNSNHTHAFPLGNLDVKHEEMESGLNLNKARSKNDISSNPNGENRNFTADSSLSVSNIEAKISSKDAFLCNLPNAPPFILKMNKTSFGTELMSDKEAAPKKECKQACVVKNDISSIMDSLELDRASHTSSTLYPTNKGYSEMSEHNLFIDNSCPTISNREFRRFLGKSISFIKNSKDILQKPSHGCFMSSPTVCLTGLSGFSISPFTMDEKDSRKRQNIASRPSTDILSNETSHQHQSKIPRMLHPGKYKVHTKMKNVQLTSGSKGYGKSQACSSRGCRDHCAAENNDIPINTIHNVANTCPSKTKTCAAGNARSEKRGSVIKNWPQQIQSSQPPVGDCVKGIKSDPGCYCPNIRDESIPCPVRLKENFPMDEEETPKEEEDDENMCYCAPGEQPLLMKKSNVECDCANRNRCENETLVEPPVEKPNVFWALTKVSLLKDGTKNFEIIDVSPLPPGYYLMPEANNLILVGPQPKPVKAPPNKNCTCK